MDKLEMARTLAQAAEHFNGLERRLNDTSKELSIHQKYLKIMDKLSRPEHGHDVSSGENYATYLYKKACQMEHEYYQEREAMAKGSGMKTACDDMGRKYPVETETLCGSET